jgi:hypothetical protein
LQKAIGGYQSPRGKWPKNSSVLNHLAYWLAQNDEKLAEALEMDVHEHLGLVNEALGERGNAPEA